MDGKSTQAYTYYQKPIESSWSQQQVSESYMNSKNFTQKQATKIMNTTVSPIERTLTRVNKMGGNRSGVTGQTGPGQLRFRPVPNRPKFKIQIWIQKMKNS